MSKGDWESSIMGSGKFAYPFLISPWGFSAWVCPVGTWSVTIY